MGVGVPGIPLGTGIVTAVVRTGRTVVCNDVAGTESLREAGAIEVAVLPLVSMGRRTGVVAVAHGSAMHLSTDENHSAFHEALQARAERRHDPFVVAIIDLDGFKSCRSRTCSAPTPCCTAPSAGAGATRS